ncbi:MAG: DUF4297 domain-containing protein [Prolixibacteraceae bacterium]|nr:DUF4297 domain-containing protein [Prolixibacteraceae bacterium]
MSSPDQILSKKDKGDETQNRFRYQNACACFISLNLLSEDRKFNELYCEQHEDILLKLTNDKFSGIQIKTKNLDLTPFDLNDEAIFNSFKRFVEHNINFPDKFESYIFATNAGLLKSDSKGVKEYVEWLKSIDIAALEKSKKDFGKFTKKIATDLDVSLEVVANALIKVKFREGLPHDGDIDDKISAKLGTINECKSSYVRVINEITNKLIKLHNDASSLKIDSDYAFLSDNPEKELTKEIIEKKRITLDKLLDIIAAEIKFDKNNLISVPINSTIHSIPKSVKVLERKMDVGNITIDNINLIKDQKYAFEVLIAEKFYKDQDQTEKDYNHLRQIALSESQISFDETYDNINAFGMQMIKDLRKRIHNRHLNNADTFRGCEIEHIFGLIAILTEECKVWWSDKFEL